MRNAYGMNDNIPVSSNLLGREQGDRLLGLLGRLLLLLLLWPGNPQPGGFVRGGRRHRRPVRRRDQQQDPGPVTLQIGDLLHRRILPQCQLIPGRDEHINRH